MRSFTICTVHRILIRIIKSRKIILAGYVDFMEETKNANIILVRIPQ